MIVAITVKIFPIAALAVSIMGYFYPEILNGYGSWIVPCLGIIMLGMGATLSVKDFTQAIRKPKAVLTGLAIQFCAMPLLAFVIANMLHLPHEQLIGLVLVGSVAGGTASNVITYIAGGDVALSITMTACSTVSGIFMTPLLTELYLGHTVDVPVLQMFLGIIKVVAVPVAIGLLINRALAKHKNILNSICPIISIIGIVLVIGIIISINHTAIAECGLLTLTAVIIHNLCGMTLGFWGAKILRCSTRTAITIAIETGMQNSGLAVALASQCFGTAAALPGAIFSIWHNLSGAMFAVLMRKKCDHCQSA